MDAAPRLGRRSTLAHKSCASLLPLLRWERGGGREEEMNQANGYVDEGADRNGD